MSIRERLQPLIDMGSDPILIMVQAAMLDPARARADARAFAILGRTRGKEAEEIRKRVDRSEVVTRIAEIAPLSDIAKLLLTAARIGEHRAKAKAVAP